MARWSDVESEAPELTKRARALFDAHTHKTLATLRKDGSPRISGVECLFVEGDLWTGSMHRATKALDLLRDPRLALHSGSDDPPAWKGDAKIAGRAEEVMDPEVIARVVTSQPPTPFHLFRVEIDELVVVTVSPDMKNLVVESWHEGRGVTTRRR